MRRTDAESFPVVSFFDKLNLHRLREMYLFALSGLLRVQHVRELFFECSHQPLKQAPVQGIGHNDARAAMLPDTPRWADNRTASTAS